MSIEQVTVAGGKYTVINDNGKLTALRNGEPWGRDLVGDQLVYAMMVEIQSLTSILDAKCKEIEDLKKELHAEAPQPAEDKPVSLAYKLAAREAK